MKNLENYYVLEMDANEIKRTNGGFFPIVIWGVVIAAEHVAALFLTGVAIGATVVAGNK